MKTDPHIILLMNEKKYFQDHDTRIDQYDDRSFCEDLILCDENNCDSIIVFKGFEAAKEYQEQNTINGRVIPLPLY